LKKTQLSTSHSNLLLLNSSAPLPFNISICFGVNTSPRLVLENPQQDCERALTFKMQVWKLHSTYTFIRNQSLVLRTRDLPGTEWFKSSLEWKNQCLVEMTDARALRSKNYMSHMSFWLETSLLFLLGPRFSDEEAQFLEISPCSSHITCLMWAARMSTGNCPGQSSMLCISQTMSLQVVSVPLFIQSILAAFVRCLLEPRNYA
jgi:hypothetical protein